MIRSLKTLWILILVLTGCYYDPYADKYTTEEPEIKDVVGTYKFEYQNVNWDYDKEKIKKNDPTIILYPDNSFEIKHIPFFRQNENTKYTYTNGITMKGTWRIGSIGSIDFGHGDLKTLWGVILESVPDELRYAGLMGKIKPDGIIFGYGDPDEGRKMTFSKK
jgi:hypothetical protein